MNFQCIHCKLINAVDDSDAGQAVTCGHCEKTVVVPATRLSGGAVINDFVIEKELGKGGVGTVYLARQMSLDRPVALKVLHSRYCDDKEFQDDFIREARAAAQLNHPNIVQAYAVGEDEGIYYFAMEYIEGTTLKQVLANATRIVVDRALSIINDVNSALDFAWTSQRLVHRDIKPDNIMLLDSGRIKLADLGLARKAGDLLDQEAEEVMGTPQYISPEQLMLKPLDCRSDIYSLGATLYHTVTGRFPYLGDTASEIARKHLTEPLTSPSSVVPDLSPAVSTLIEIMMAKRPEHRYSDGAELKRDLELVMKGQFPQKPLSPDSQVPLALDGEAAAGAPGHSSSGAPGSRTVAGKPGGRRLLVRSKSAGPKADGTSTGPLPVVTPVSGSMSSTPGVASPSAEAAAAEGVAVLPDVAPVPAEATPLPSSVRVPRAKKSSLKLYIALLAVLLTGALVGGVTLLILSRRDARMPPFEKHVRELRRKYPKEHVQAFLNIVQAVREQKPDAELVGMLKQYDEAYPEKSDITVDVHAQLDPFIEKELTTLRKARHGAELQDWHKQTLDLKDKDRQAKEKEKAELDKIEAEKRAAMRLEEEKKKKAAAMEAFKKQQVELRWQAVELCRDSKFSDAKALFIAMAGSKDKEISEWAQLKQACIDKAETAANLVLDSKGALKGLRINLPGHRGIWKIQSIGQRDVVVESNQINKKGEVDAVQETMAFDEMLVATRVELLEKGIDKRGGASAGVDKNLAIGAYLLAKGPIEGFTLCQQRLAAAAKPDEAAPYIEEAKEVEAVVKVRQFEVDLARLKQELRASGNSAEVRSQILLLKSRFPEQYQAVENDILQLQTPTPK